MNFKMVEGDMLETDNHFFSTEMDAKDKEYLRDAEIQLSVILVINLACNLKNDQTLKLNHLTQTGCSQKSERKKPPI
jgi:hypothetical protein